MKRFAKLLTLSLICLGLTACSAIGNNFSSLTKKSDMAYLKAKATPGLKVPAGLSSAKVGDSFNVPPTSSTGPVPVATTPPGGVYKAAVPGQPKEKAKSGQFLKPVFK